MKLLLKVILTPVLMVLVLALLVVAGQLFGVTGVVLLIALPLLFFIGQSYWRQATNNRYVDPSLPPLPALPPLVPRPPVTDATSPRDASTSYVQIHPVARSFRWLQRLEYLLAALWVLWFTPAVYNGLFSAFHVSRGIGMQRVFAQLGALGIAVLLAVIFISVQQNYFVLRLRARWLSWLAGCGVLMLVLWLRSR